MSFESPPLVSGVVVVSGSNAFSVTSSDFPVAMNLVMEDYFTTPTVYGSTASGTYDRAAVTASGGVGGLRLSDYLLTNPVIHGLTASGTYDRAQVVASGVVAGLRLQDYTATPVISVDAAIMGYPADWLITETETTTSGVVIFEMGIGVGTPYIVPVVIDERLFPVSLTLFPTNSGIPTTISGERIYPVLPQFSTIIP